MKKELRKILEEELYTDSGISGYFVAGIDEAVEKLNTLFIDKMFEAARNGLTCTQISSRGDCATFPPSITCEPQSHEE